MDQVNTGRFIACARKERGQTQKQLADAIGVSDKTVSKWECGKGMPEVSLMLPLCSALDITVNELLSAERIPSSEYQRKAEENIMDLIKENENSKKRFAASIILGVITIVAVIALVCIAAFVELPTAIRIAIIVFAALSAAAGIAAACMLDIQTGYFECPYCGAHIVPSMKDYVNGAHTLTKRRLTCPECGKTGMCRHRITEKK